jgi:hypothetical protein
MSQARINIPWHDAEALSGSLQQQVVKETVSALGVLCAAMRWGEDTRVQKAIEKLSAVGDFLLNGYDTYSWFLAKLCSEAAVVYSNSSLRLINTIRRLPGLHKLQELSD